MRAFEVPVIVNVYVEVDDEGNARAMSAHPDNDAGPWPFSSDPAAYEDSYEGVLGIWHEGFGEEDEPYMKAWNAAYDQLRVNVGNDPSGDGRRN